MEAIRVWFDAEADFLEVTLRDRPGTYHETALDQVMAKVDESGEVIGFSILKVSALKGKPLELSLATIE